MISVGSCEKFDDLSKDPIQQPPVSFKNDTVYFPEFMGLDDGVTDYSRALNIALQEHGTVIVSDGIYILDSTVTVGSYRRLNLSGPSERYARDSTGVTFVPGPNVEILFNSNGSESYMGHFRVSRTLGSNIYCDNLISVINVSGGVNNVYEDIVIRDIRSHNPFTGIAITGPTSNTLHFKNVRVFNCTYGFKTSTNNYNCRLDNCRFFYSDTALYLERNTGFVANACDIEQSQCNVWIKSGLNHKFSDCWMEWGLPNFKVGGPGQIIQLVIDGGYFWGGGNNWIEDNGGCTIDIRNVLLYGFSGYLGEGMPILNKNYYPYSVSYSNCLVREYQGSLNLKYYNSTDSLPPTGDFLLYHLANLDGARVLIDMNKSLTYGTGTTLASLVNLVPNYRTGIDSVYQTDSLHQPKLHREELDGWNIAEFNNEAYLDLGDELSFLSDEQEGSFIIIFKVNSTSGVHNIFSNLNSNSGSGFTLNTSNRINFGIRKNGSYYCSFSKGYIVPSDYFIVGVTKFSKRDSTVVNLMIDGLSATDNLVSNPKFLEAKTLSSNLEGNMPDRNAWIGQDNGSIDGNLVFLTVLDRKMDYAEMRKTIDALNIHYSINGSSLWPKSLYFRSVQ